MGGLIARLRGRGEIALRRGGMLAVSGVVALLALVFLSASVVAAFATVVPVYLAMLIGAVLLLGLAAVCAALSRRYAGASRRLGKTRLPDHAIESKADALNWRQLLEDHSANVVSAAFARDPRKLMLAGLAAGGAILALEALGRRIR